MHDLIEVVGGIFFKSGHAEAHCTEMNAGPTNLVYSYHVIALSADGCVIGFIVSKQTK